MKGQWIGRYKGTNEGSAIIEIDDFGDHFEGRAYAYEDDMRRPSTFGFIRTKDKSKNFELEIDAAPIHPETGEITEWRSLAERFPGLTFPAKAHTRWECEDEKIKLRWSTDIGTTGEAILSRSNAKRPSKLKPLAIETWDEFRRHYRQLEPDRYIYRGQETNRWRLQTSFHRTHRSDLVRYMASDLSALHGNLSSLTTHFFNLTDPVQNGAFVNLIQHHGYPTPLLDWTHSPFIAAYFAFKKAKPSPKPKFALRQKDKIRIFVFDARQWVTDWRQLQKMAPARPHFSLFNPVSLNNPRMVPQQALSSVTNMEDIEEYIQTKETSERTYLQAVDLPLEERIDVLKELNAMGITSGSLFPGLDGACEQLKDRFFGYD